MKYEKEYGALLKHSHLLRASLNLAHDRRQQLQRTLVSLGFSEMPRDRDDITRVQVQAAKDIGGIKTRMLLDASIEMEKYHFGPLQMSLCLLNAMLDEYSRLTGINAVFADGDLETFLRRNDHMLQSLKGLRNSILYERYDTLDIQKQFVLSPAGDPVQLAIEGEQIFQRYLKLVRKWLQGDE